LTYYEAWWNGTRVNKKFPTAKKAETYLKKRKALNGEIIEKDEQSHSLRSWIVNPYIGQDV